MALSVVVVAYGCAVDPENLRPAPPAAGGTASSGGSGTGGRSSSAHGGTSGSNRAGGQAGVDGVAGESGTFGVVYPVCGDGQRDPEEECDDGNLEGGDGCTSGCNSEPSGPACGDSLKQGQEECDDGNLEAGDGCDPECREERCGNLRVDSGEECDPPTTGKCTASCSFVRLNCGNGDIDKDDDDPSRDEECDDGNDVAGDGCFDCRFECGDKRIDRSIGEECDRGLYPERCSSTCQWLAACGDGEVDQAGGEQCDPSNGRTCVACRTVVPPDECAGGAGNTSEGGAGGCASQSECTPQGVSNLIQNGTFDANTNGWLRHSNSVTLSLANDGDPAPQALDVALEAGQVRAQSGGYQCIPVKADRKYDLSARYKIPSSVPEGVGVTITTVLYTGTSCLGAYVGTPGPGPFSAVRNAWTPYSLEVDTTPLSGDGRLLVRLDVVRPAAVTGAHALWDTVSLASPDGICGNCELDPGEACDDGNQTSGDGCSATCGLELCGDGNRTSSEQCDDGNAVFGAAGDNCTPSCRTPTACDTCAVSSCGPAADACLGLEGTAEGGPKAGFPRSTLCDALRLCAQATSCHLVSRENVVEGAFLENCYCGTAGDDCFEPGGGANGTCRAEVEAALETTKPTTVAGRLSGADAGYPAFAAVDALLACELGSCPGTCVRESSCGDGFRQDRTLDLQFFVGGQYVACNDTLTTTGRGCYFEECDDGNAASGDGCDEHCLLEACGNYLIQAGEDCDDGNTVSGDGCDEDCKAEYDCGDGVIESIEQCDPPAGDHGCSQAEYESNAAQCACDPQCKRVVCGNEKVQRPLEDCDPPDGVVCGDDCKRLDQGPCETCIASNPDTSEISEYYCTSADCITIKRCVFESGCHWPLGAYACYCGPEIVECYDNPDFVPVGPCRELIAAAVGPPGLENAVVLERATLTTNPSGQAFAVVAAARDLCFDECFPDAE